MPKNKYAAVWVSHSSIGDYLKCPRAYFLKNVYKDPTTNHKIKIVNPAMSLGQAVHKVIESLSILPIAKRFKEPLLEKFEQVWKQVCGEKGGFTDPDTESIYKIRGQKMIQRVIDNPGPIKKLAVKITENLPFFWLSEKDNIILCGKIDWLEYLPDTDSVHLIDFKTGKSKEDPDSLQLPIYHLLVHNCQKRKVKKASYWYLDSSDTLTPRKLPNLKNSRQKVLQIAKKIKLARQLQNFKCHQSDGCFACKPFEAILQKKGKLVAKDDYGSDVYILPTPTSNNKESVIL